MTSDQIVTVLVAMVGSGFLVSLVQGLYQRKKMGADYADVIAKSATTLLTPLATRVEELQEELSTERKRVRSLARDLDDARDHLEAARRAVRSLRAELEEVRTEATAERHEIEQRRSQDDH